MTRVDAARIDRPSRFWLFVYSNGNVAGCLLGLAGVALYLLGIIDQGWLAISLGLYAAGYFAAPATAQVRMNTAVTVETLLAALDQLIAGSSKRLPAEALPLLANIRATIADILPRLAELKAALPLDTAHSFTIAETVTRYLPDALDSYLRLPPMYAVAHHVDGKTPKQLLLGQLNLLDSKLKDIGDDLFRGDAEALAMNGRFLEDKFRASDTEGR